MKKIAFIGLMFLSIALQARVQNDPRALIIYQFTKLIDWPAGTKNGMFRIGVLGSLAGYKDLSDVTMGRNVGSQNIEVMNVMSISQLKLATFHILLVGDDFCTPEKMAVINEQLKGKATLVVAQKVNYTGTGICIGFEEIGQRYKYTYKTSSIESKGLKCSQDFLLMGKKSE